MTNVDDEKDPAVTPLQDQRTCTRNSLCKAAGCQICATPGSETHHVRDLTDSLENTSSPKVSNKPSAPPGHIIPDLVDEFQEAISSNDLDILEATLNLFNLATKTCTDFIKYDCSELYKLMKTAKKMTAPSFQTPPTPTGQQPQQLPQPPKPQTIGLKTPRMENPSGSDHSYDFYPWISSCCMMFDQSNCSDMTRTQLMFQGLPIDKRSSLVHVDNWEEFKSKLVNEFGSIKVFRCKALKLFTQLYQPLQNVK